MEDELRTMMQRLVSEMKGEIVSEILKGLSDDAASEVTVQAPQRAVGTPRGATTDISSTDDDFRSVTSTDRVGNRMIHIQNGDQIVVPLDCETLYKENNSPDAKQIKKITLTNTQVGAFVTKSDILAWFKEHFVSYYRYGGQLHLIHMVDSSVLEQIRALLRSEMDWIEATPQDIMDEVFRCSWEVPQSAHDYRVGLKLLTFPTLVADVRFDFDAVIFRTACAKLLAKSAVKYSKSAASNILAQMKEPLLVNHLTERVDLLDSFEGFWMEYSDRVTQLEAAAKVMGMKQVKKPPKAVCELCSKEGHYATNREGTSILCPQALATPDKFKTKAATVIAARAKKFADQASNTNAAPKKNGKQKTGGVNKVLSSPIAGEVENQGHLSEQLYSPTPLVVLSFKTGATLSDCYLDGGSVSNIMPLGTYLSSFGSIALSAVPELVHLYSSTGEVLQIVGVLSVECTCISSYISSEIPTSDHAPQVWPRKDCYLEFFVCSNATDVLLNNYTTDVILDISPHMMGIIKKQSKAVFPQGGVHKVARGVKCAALTDAVFDALASLHNASEGHIGSGRLHAQARKKYPNLRITHTMCRTFIHLCPRCQKDRRGVSFAAMHYTLNDTYYEYIFADTLEVRFKGVVYYTLVLVHYASRFCVLKRLPGKKAKHIAKALLEANAYLPFRHVVLQTDQGPEYLNSVNHIILKALMVKRFAVTNKGSHQENAIVERVMLEIRRFFDPIVVELSEMIPTLQSDELGDDDLLDISLHMVTYLLNHLETHRGPSPITILMPLFADQPDSMIAIPEYTRSKGDHSFLDILYEIQLRILKLVDNMDQRARDAHLSNNPDDINSIPAPEFHSLVLLEVGYSRSTPRFVGPYLVINTELQMVELQSLTSTDRYKVHRSRVKPYLDDPRNFPPEVIAARDYSESIVFDILGHRFIDGNPKNKLIDNLEFHIQFSKIAQWLPYTDVKHLKILDDYALSAGLSWLARSPNTSGAGNSAGTVNVKSIDTARTHIKKARGRKSTSEPVPRSTGVESNPSVPSSSATKKGKVNLVSTVWAPVPFDSVTDLTLDQELGYTAGMFTPYTTDEIKSLLQIGNDRFRPAIEAIALRTPQVWSASPTPVNLPPVDFQVEVVTKNMYVPARVIHNPLALQACELILNELEFHGIIEPIPAGKDTYQVNVPVSVVKDKVNADGTIVWRVVLDNRIVNDNLLKIPFPTSLVMQDIYDEAVGKEFIGTLDAPKAFYGIRVAESSRYLSSFIHPVRKTRYWFTRLVMGNTNSPAIQQQFFLQTLQTYKCWIDDVVIATNDEADFLDRLAALLAIALKFNFKFNLKKCRFLYEPSIVLGRYVGVTGMQPLEKHLLSVANFPLPKTVKQLQHFLGCGNWLRAFIMDYGVLAAPMHKLVASATANAGKLKWAEGDIAAFERLRTAIINHSPLFPFDHHRPIFVASDACDTGYGGVVFHTVSDSASGIETDNKQLISMVSGGFSKAQLKWNTTEKEAYGFYMTIMSHSRYLSGRSFHIFTDHQALTYLVESVNAKVQRWKLALQEYQFEITHLPGERNVEPDSLSRLVHFMGQ